MKPKNSSEELCLRWRRISFDWCRAIGVVVLHLVDSRADRIATHDRSVEGLQHLRDRRWISESRVTPDLLAEAGYDYLLDWGIDDQPIWFRTRGGKRILSVPYPQEVNDIPAIVARLSVM